MNGNEFETLRREYGDLARAIARKLARRNDSLAEELEQEGLVALWFLKPENIRKNRDAYIRQAMKFRMVDELRRLQVHTRCLPWQRSLVTGCRGSRDNYDGRWVEEPLWHDVPDSVMNDPWRNTDTALDLGWGLAGLSPADRDMLLWMYGVEEPNSPGVRPGNGGSFARIAQQLAEKYGTPLVSEATLRYRRDVLIARWRKARHLRELWTLLDAA